MVGLCCNVASALLSERGAAKVDNDLRCNANLFRGSSQWHALPDSGYHVGDRIPGLLIVRGHGEILPCGSRCSTYCFLPLISSLPLRHSFSAMNPAFHIAPSFRRFSDAKAARQ